MTSPSSPSARPELGALDKLFLGGKVKSLIGWQEQEIARLHGLLDEGSSAYRALDQWVAAHGGPEIVGNEQALDKSRKELSRAKGAVAAARNELQTFRGDIRLESAGDIDRAHPAQDSIALAAELRDLRTQIKVIVKDGRAVSAVEAVDTSSLSLPKRRRAATRLSTLALRAFNAEADAVIAAATATNEEASAQKIARSADAIGKLLDTFEGQISSEYVQLKIRELRLAVQHAKARAFEKELEKERRAELREQAKAERELEAERERLRKELAHYENIREAMREKGDDEGIARMEAKLVEIQHGIEDVDHRAANIRAGYVYVISNLGAFGERMVKIGLTRRLDPMDRVRELGDASVPFGFDVHALFFSDDAVGVEAELHRRFSTKRVNRVNLRREFFYATPAEVRDQLADIAGDLIDFREDPEAEQFRESIALAEKGLERSAVVDDSAVADGFDDVD
ncbi:DUF4041 domain-containing protein [Brachybacterium sp. NBEC-018]|uniref:DUF4041 domain-containing protein n=1 Tax=Brachybacterium sp. NBEC-018 TaxID=2996004 RepID=UPI0021753B1C|nr:DUF4041 domain-containing protein [Brachybacterium sp. NBEC-018]UVY84507.1 DUF4041 domain-containing protein [Brachybacterium sp. NBEC-018]